MSKKRATKGMTKRQLAAWLRKFYELLALGNVADKDVAIHLHEGIEQQGEDYFEVVFRDEGLASSTAKMYFRMARTWKDMPNHTLWKAIGYRPCARLLEIPMTERQRSEIVRELLERCNGQGYIKSAHKALHEEVEKRVPGAFQRTKLEDDDEKGDNGYREPGPGENAETDHELLVREVRELASGQLSVLLDLLSPRALKICGLKRLRRTG